MVFRCSDKSACLNNTQVCDGKKDCDDNSDETGCPTNCPICSKLDFKCHKTCQCITMYFVCDNDHECSDKSDEIGCPKSNATHPTTTTGPTTTTQVVSTKQTTTAERLTTRQHTTRQPTTVQSTTQQQTTTVEQTTTPRTPLPPMSCENNHIYKSCSRTCKQKCAYLTYNCIEDSRQCAPGCGCQNNLVSNGTFCVLPSECSCYDYLNGRFARPNEKWRCGCSTCTCFNNAIVRTPQQCPSPAPCPYPRRMVLEPGKCCKTCKSGPFPTTAAPPTSTPVVCRADFFKCDGKRCISNEWVCDGERDCADATDELYCTTLKQPECNDAIGNHFFSHLLISY